MKSIILFSIFLTFLFTTSCDKVKRSLPKSFIDVDTTLLEGMDMIAYKSTLWPNWENNTNTKVNVLIEDFTGHKCSECPIAAIEAENLEHQYENRVFATAIHIGPLGAVTTFQNYSYNPYKTNFTTPEGIEISSTISDGGFSGNPSGTINRKNFGGFLFQNYTSWGSCVSNILNANILKVNLQSKANYIEGTRGVFLHTEVDKLTSDELDLYQVVYLVEDSIVKPQAMSDETTNLNYVHRNVHRGNLDGKGMGRKITEAMKVDKNGNPLTGNKYYLNYSYKLPTEYNPENMHLLIYVYDNATKEVLQVIKQKIIE